MKIVSSSDEAELTGSFDGRERVVMKLVDWDDIAALGQDSVFVDRTWSTDVRDVCLAWVNSKTGFGCVNRVPVLVLPVCLDMPVLLSRRSWFVTAGRASVDFTFAAGCILDLINPAGPFILSKYRLYAEEEA